MSFLNSRKVSWIILESLFDCSSKFIFLPDIIPVHFGILGTPDGWDYKMGICYFRFCNFSFCF